MTDSSQTGSGHPGGIQRTRFTGQEITPARLRCAIEIIEASFPRWPAFEISVPTVEHLRWKLEYPGWAPNFLSIATVDGVAAGIYVLIHRKFSIGGHSYRVRDWQDSCVQPDFQSQGIYSFMEKKTREDEHEIDFGFWSTVNPRIIAAQKKFPRCDIELGSDLKALVRAVAPSGELAARYLPAAGSTLRRFALSVAISVVRNLGAVRLAKVPANDRLEIRRLEDTGEILDLFDSLLEGMPRPTGLFQERNRDYIRWRYCDVRGGQCTVLGAFENGEPMGAAVCKMSYDIGSLIDLLTDHARQDVASELIAATGDLLEREGAAAIVCWVTGDSPLRKILRAHRFVPSPLKTACQINPAVLSTDELEALLEGRSHHLMMGDFDWV